MVAANQTRPGLGTRAAAGVASLAPPRLRHELVARLHPRVEPMLAEVTSRCDPDCTAVDVGAWYGPWTYWLSRRVRTVETFEPNPELAALLRSAVRPNVTIHEAALSSVAGTATLHVPVSGLGSEGTASLESMDAATSTHEVQTLRLDDRGLEHVGFIKIDVEGHERSVLEGGLDLLARDTPVLVVELDARMGDITPTIGLLEGLGYKGKVQWQGAWRDLGSFDLPHWQRSHADQASPGYLSDVLRGGRWVNNVAWVHPQSAWSPW